MIMNITSEEKKKITKKTIHLLTREYMRERSRAMIKKQRWFRIIKKEHSKALKECGWYINNEEND
jgi:hypothetical protein